MSVQFESSLSLPPATIFSVPIFDFAIANSTELAKLATEQYYSCCGKSICGGCIDSFVKSENTRNCPFCKAQISNITDDERVGEVMKRVAANDARAIYMMGNDYYHGKLGLLQDREKAMELWKQAATLGSSEAHFQLGSIYKQGGAMKKAKFHYEAAAMAGDEVARNNLGCAEAQSGNMERAIKHWTIAASAGDHNAMHQLTILFQHGALSRDQIDSFLIAYNDSCAEMRSEARDTYIRTFIDSIGAG
jgi:TPR repeat protein